ncbi:MAG: hypothetical protein FWD31_10270 [Planctomycetaceae bacterium]|nr:hypothetical protein [Planctomycetaceae bacterium]
MTRFAKITCNSSQPFRREISSVTRQNTGTSHKKTARKGGEVKDMVATHESGLT